MSLSFDATLCRALARELDRRLHGRRTRAVFFDRRTPALQLVLADGALRFRLGPADAGLDLIDGDPGDPPAAARTLPCRVGAVEALADERILRVHLQRVRGSVRHRKLVIELAGNRANAFLLEGEQGVVRHALRSRPDGPRPLMVGRPWTPPPPSTRLGVGGAAELGREGFAALLDELRAAAAVDEAALRSGLLRRLAWASRLNADALAALVVAGRDDDAWALWTALADPPEGGAGILEHPTAGPHPYPMPLPGHAFRPTGSLLEAFLATAPAPADGAAPRPRADAGALLPGALLERLEAARTRARRRVTSLERALDEAADPAALRALGDLLLARLHEVPRGAAEVVLTGFDGAPVRVELDPARAPQENAEAYYDRAGRAERAARRLPAELDQARRAAERLDELAERARSGALSATELEAALPPPAARDRTPADERLPYRRYRSRGGLEIRVGRGAADNDALTFHHARPNDVWLHARHAAGAHVVLRWDRDEPPPARDLEDAAVLAALHSRARTSGTVPVDWTRRKYVRKPRGARPGSVIPERVRTLFVEPDETRARALEDEAPEG